MATLQIQARALGDPTRHEIFRYIRDADRPVGVAELTRHLRFNHNAIRQHLAKLVDADLLVESAAPSVGRGRPALEYTIDPSTDARWGVTGPYERLSILLTELVSSGDTPVEVGHRAGQRLPLEGPTNGEPIAAFVTQMERFGFDPTVRERAGRVDVTLQICPFASAVLADPDTVCDLHLGLAQGLADALGGIVVDELVRKDPRRANCRLRCRVAPADAAATATG